MSKRRNEIHKGDSKAHVDARLKMAGTIRGGDFVLLDGTVMRIGDAEKGKSLTLADVAENALLSDYRDEQNLDGVEKLKRWTLAKKIEDTKSSVTLNADEIALIKKLVGKAYNPLVYGEMVQAIDPASLPK